MSQPSTTVKYTLLVLIALIWGSQFMFNTVVLRTLTPEGVAWLRAFIGFLTLCAVIPFTSERKVKLDRRLKTLGFLFLIGFFEATMPFYLIAWGQQHVTSSITSILMATIALFTLVMVMLFVKHEKVTLFKILGLILGFIGVVILLSPGLLEAGPSLMKNLMGELAILAGALCFAIALVLIRVIKIENAPIRTARAILFSAVIQLGVISLIVWQPFWTSTPGFDAISSILLLGIFAAGIVYVLYVRLINTAGATFAGFTNYLVPLVGVIAGVSIMGDPLHPSTIVALVIILIAMVVCEWKGKQKSS